MRHRPFRRAEAGQPHPGAPHRLRTHVHAPHAPRRLLVGAALAIALAGCGRGSGKSDAQRVRDNVGRAVETDSGAQVARVQCPDDFGTAKDDVFVCSVEVYGQALRVRVRVTDDRGEVAVQPEEAVLSVAKTASAIERTVKEQNGLPVTANCGDRAVLVKEVGSTFECIIVGPDGSRRRVAVTVKDVQGNFDFKPI